MEGAEQTKKLNVHNESLPRAIQPLNESVQPGVLVFLSENRRKRHAAVVFYCYAISYIKGMSGVKHGTNISPCI